MSFYVCISIHWTCAVLQVSSICENCASSKNGGTYMHRRANASKPLPHQLIYVVYALFGICIAFLMIYGYEASCFPLDKHTDLPAYAMERSSMGTYKVNDRLDVQGVTLFLLECPEQTYNLVVAFPRSCLFSRFGQDFETLRVGKKGTEVIVCQFEPRFLLHGLQLGGEDVLVNDIAPNTYFFTRWFNTKLQYSSTFNTGRESAVLATQLIPYMFTVPAVLGGLWLFAFAANRRRTVSSKK